MATQIIRGSVLNESLGRIPGKISLHDNDIVRTRNGDYKVLKVLGKGGFGTVYKVISLADNKVYALKVLNLWEMLPDEYDFLTRKFNLGYRTGRLKSDNIVRSEYINFLEGNPFIVMEFCENKNLEENLAYFNSEDKYIKLAAEILNGLETLHTNGVIHRDLKPENILFDENMTAKLTDFDLSANLNNRLTETNIFGHVKVAYGTIIYAAPEQLKVNKYFKMTLPSMDIYSFAATMYFVLSNGHNPFGQPTLDIKGIEEFKKRKEKEKHIPLKRHNPHVEPKWEKLMEKCLEPDPNKRVQSIGEVRAILGIRDGWVPRSSGPSLKVITGARQADYSLNSYKKGVIKLGRADGSNDIEIEEHQTQYISRKQCTLEKIGREWYLRDGQFVMDQNMPYWRNSPNGTVVNNHRLTGRDFHKLGHGDYIRLGDCVVKFEKF